MDPNSFHIRFIAIASLAATFGPSVFAPLHREELCAPGRSLEQCPGHQDLPEHQHLWPVTGNTTITSASANTSTSVTNFVGTSSTST